MFFSFVIDCAAVICRNVETCLRTVTDRIVTFEVYAHSAYFCDWSVPFLRVGSYLSAGQYCALCVQVVLTSEKVGRNLCFFGFWCYEGYVS